MVHLHAFKRGGLAAVVTALLFVFYVPTASATAAQGVVVSQVATSQQVYPDCCAGAWYPWGWYYTKAKCTTAGKNVVATVPVALAYKCTYHTYPPASANSRHYQLSIFEAT